MHSLGVGIAGGVGSHLQHVGVVRGGGQDGVDNINWCGGAKETGHRVGGFHDESLVVYQLPLDGKPSPGKVSLRIGASISPL